MFALVGGWPASDIVEVRCLVPVELARSRYRARAAGRHIGHLDADRTYDELWAEPVRPLKVGPLIEVDTSGPVDIVALAAQLVAANDEPPTATAPVTA
jgi:hypothetical protein